MLCSQAWSIPVWVQANHGPSHILKTQEGRSASVTELHSGQNLPVNREADQGAAQLGRSDERLVGDRTPSDSEVVGGYSSEHFMLSAGPHSTSRSPKKGAPDVRRAIGKSALHPTLCVDKGRARVAVPGLGGPAVCAQGVRDSEVGAAGVQVHVEQLRRRANLDRCRVA